MIPLSTDPCQDTDWKKALATAIRQPSELLRAVGLRTQQLPEPIDDSAAFPLRVPRVYVERMRHGDPADPLLRQVLALHRERETSTGYSLDPVGDGPAIRRPGLLQKYHGRALIITTGACPIHCRYCFRRHFPYNEAHASTNDWRDTLAHIAADTNINEVILSGGDPLSLDTPRLRTLSEGLRDIPHIRRLRIHTRMPVVLPQRIDNEFLVWLTELPWPTVVVIHANHANEIDDAVRRRLHQIQAANATLLNQAVLLQGVNDSLLALADLSENLFEAGVLPYYLHLLDHVQGSAHFAVNETRAHELMEQLRRQLPGYLVPRLVREQAGAPYKQLLIHDTSVMPGH
ncbi:Lysine 2,3-aminomutase [hydrothermal vent metagenome]|uniref:L-lysine 2,3-aminomutase n=1 Tax=hydrothermal vent metagenome TaxID=652676 RepID=A0A3B1AQ04_9ZZZZ